MGQPLHCSLYFNDEDSVRITLIIIKTMEIIYSESETVYAKSQVHDDATSQKP